MQGSHFLIEHNCGTRVENDLRVDPTFPIIPTRGGPTYRTYILAIFWYSLGLTQEPFGLEPKKSWIFFRGPVWPPLLDNPNRLYLLRNNLPSSSLTGWGRYSGEQLITAPWKQRNIKIFCLKRGSGGWFLVKMDQGGWEKPISKIFYLAPCQIFSLEGPVGQHPPGHTRSHFRGHFI